MPVPAGIRVENLREVQAALKGIDRSLGRQLTAVNRDAARLVAVEAERSAPRRTGRLGSSIRATAQQRAGQVRAGTVKVPYAGVIEFGWPAHNIAAQPFLFPSLEAKREDVIDLYDRLIRELVDRYF